MPVLLLCFTSHTETFFASDEKITRALTTESVEGARNLKLLLYVYELMAGLKINLHKSEVLTINDEDNWAATYAEIFNCQVGTFPVKYLGYLLVPADSSRSLDL